ncbi:MAG: hypothetical protein QOI42_2018 [Frankiaceae bacterium]|nr:hypothetical protein [Frankiaceae bacterium]
MRAGRVTRPLAVLAGVLGVATAVLFAPAAGSAPLTDRGSTAAAAALAAACPTGGFAGFDVNGIALCVHADNATLSPAIALPQALPGVPCYPSAGPRVHVYFAYKAGSANTLAKQRAQLRDVVAQTDAIYAQSARDSGGTRHIRWLMDGSCHLVITPLVVTDVSANPYAPFRAVVASRTLAATDHALIFLNYSYGAYACGYGSLRDDARASSLNQSNHYQGTAEVFNGECRDDGRSAAHELGHTLGAVQFGAPHASYQGHCYDGYLDVMCYDDGSIPAPMRTGSCPDGAARTFDCGHDDYFNANPRAGTYLATHWNVANSALLARTGPSRWDAIPNPTIAITNVTPGSTYAAAAATSTPMTVTVNAAGGAVAAVQYYIDDTEIDAPVTAAPYDGPDLGLYASDFTNGAHHVYAQVKLTNGVTRLSPFVAFTVVNGRPQSAATPAGTARLKLAAGATLRSGGVATLPFAVTGAKGRVTSVQVITRSGFMQPVSVAAGATSVRVRMPSYRRGADSVWLRVYLSNGDTLFTNHVSIRWG